MTEARPTPPGSLWSQRGNRGLVAGAGTLIVLALVAGMVTQATKVTGTAALHLQIEYFAVFVAVSIFFLSSAKYAMTRQRIYLPVSLGFLAAAIFDLLHPLIPAGDVHVSALGMELVLRDLGGYLWWVSRLSVGFGFLGSALAYRQGHVDEHPSRILVRSLVWTLTEILLLVALLVVLPLPSYYGSPALAPAMELLPVAVYAAAGYWLLRVAPGLGAALRIVGLSSLALGVVAQLFAALSTSPSDGFFFVAHAFKITSYLVVLFGLYLEHINLYAQERDLRQSVERAEQEALRRRGELLAVIENTADGIAISDIHGRLVHLNQAAQQVFGLAPGSHYVGSRLADVVAPPQTDASVDPAFRDALRAALEGGRDVRDIEMVVARADGSTHYLSVGVVPLRSPEGVVRGAVADFHDITSLRVAERRYRELTEGAPDGIIEMGQDGSILFFNRAAERIFGYSKEDVMGRDVRTLIPDRLRDQHAQARDVFFATGNLRLGGRPLELPALRKDGTEFAIELTLSKSGAARSRRVTAIVRDVQALQRGRRERAALVAVAGAVNASADLPSLASQVVAGVREALGFDTLALYVKDAQRPFLRLMGVAGAVGTVPSTFQGFNLEPPEPSLSVASFLDRKPHVAEGRERAHQTTPLTRSLSLADDALVLTVPVLVAGEAIGTLGGVTSRRRHQPAEEVPLLEAIAFQIALALSQKKLLVELQETAKNLAASNRELDAFIYTASHDLAEPLRSMANFSQFLLEDYAGSLDAQGQDYLKRIHDGALRMRGLLDALLQISRIRHKPLPFEVVDTQRLMGEVKDSLDAMLRDKKGVLVVPERLPNVYGQPQRLLEVFSNLISNGLKFNESKEPKVEVDAATHNGFVEFSVRDNGIGIPAQFQDRVFGLFTRLHPRSHYPGTGAGLAIVRTIIEQHGGEVRLQSKEGEGTVVTFTLPKGKT